MNTNIFKEISMALNDNSPVENIASLCAVEMWQTTKNPFWMRVWLELNAAQYQSTTALSNDFSEVFAL